MTAERGMLHETLVRDEAIAGPSDRRFGFTIAVAGTSASPSGTTIVTTQLGTLSHSYEASMSARAASIRP